MFLITDPLPAISVDYYRVDLDGTIEQVDAQLSDDTTEKRLHWELPPLADGDHTVTIQAVNAWGEGVWSDPFVFTSAVPPQVTGIALSTT
jgi:hypothetical protein